ncbi:MAG: hypothetical protein J6V83_00595 [Clostridia bacterium]|nr:hypothetical protein [Clostridia bacterium]MBO7155882.1 hypothetical protein [Clostridia bacterium]
MHLLVVNLKDREEFRHVLKELNNEGLNGIVFASHSLHDVMHADSIESVPVFGILSKITHRSFDTGHTLMMLVEPDRMEVAKNTVRDIVKDLTHKGVMFSVPVDYFEGL